MNKIIAILAVYEEGICLSLFKENVTTAEKCLFITTYVFIQLPVCWLDASKSSV